MCCGVAARKKMICRLGSLFSNFPLLFFLFFILKSGRRIVFCNICLKKKSDAQNVSAPTQVKCAIFAPLSLSYAHKVNKSKGLGFHTQALILGAGSGGFNSTCNIKMKSDAHCLTLDFT